MISLKSRIEKAMRNYRTLLPLAVAVLLLACNFPLFAAAGRPRPTATPSLTAPSPLPTTLLPSETPLPTDTPLPTATPLPSDTPTPSVPIAWPKDQPVNCRFGPGTAWLVVSALPLGQSAEIVGRNAENTWWRIKDALNPGSFCWVAMSVTNAAGNLALIPVQPAPQASVIKVEVGADVAFTACGGPNPIVFNGSITTNGPTEVSYRWEVSGDKENTTSPETMTFDKADTKTLTTDVYKADCGTYFITLHVLEPNDTSARKKFTVP